MHVRITIAILALAALLTPAWAQNTEEEGLINTLSSGATSQEKDAACKRLKEIGTARAVPALAACLTDDFLSQPARDALRVLPGPEAAQALLAGIQETSGINRAGIIDSLGARREETAIPTLCELLADRQEVVAAAAARALGSIGAPAVIDPLQRALPRATGKVRAAVIDALLTTSVQLRNDGDTKRSAKVAKFLLENDGIETHVRTAAHRAVILAASPKKQQTLILRGIKSKDSALQQAALALAAEVPSKTLGKALAKLLDAAPPEIQAALLMALDHRNDPAACGAVMKLAASPEPGVRMAALTALGSLGDASCVPFLAGVAAHAAADEQKAARQTLGQVRHGDVHAALLALLANTEPAIQIEAAKAAALRRDREAISALFALAAAQGDDAVRAAAVRALGSLGDEPDTVRLIKLLAAVESAPLREDIEDAIVAIAGMAPGGNSIVDTLLAQTKTQPLPVRIAGLRGAARIDAARALQSLRDAMQDGDPELRYGALRIMASHAGMDALPDLLAAAAAAADDAQNTIALRGYWRLADTTKASPPAERLAIIRAGLDRARTLDDRKAALGVLASVCSRDALAFAEQACGDEAVRMEAETAACKIALGLFATDRATAEAALRRLAESARAERVRTDAAEFKKNVDDHANYVIPWLVSQPYRVEGKRATDLFDTPLGPELPGEQGVIWSTMPITGDPQLFWQVDLLSAVAGDECVIYLKTKLFWPRTEDVQLEMGSDDGIKVWLNGRQVHANNAVRSLTPEQDKAAATLNEGWNDFLVKISQISAGCAMTMRLAPSTGDGAQPLRVEAR